jgi:hypothetical protein
LTHTHAQTPDSCFPCQNSTLALNFAHLLPLFSFHFLSCTIYILFIIELYSLSMCSEGFVTCPSSFVCNVLNVRTSCCCPRSVALSICSYSAIYGHAPSLYLLHSRLLIPQPHISHSCHSVMSCFNLTPLGHSSGLILHTPS